MVFFSLALLILFVHFVVAELVLRKGAVAKSIKPTPSDKGSSLLIGINFFLILAMTVVSVVFLREVSQSIFPIFGLILMIIGSGIRIWAAVSLGQFYTRTLVVTNSQKLLKTGLYRFIRHPGYLGMILLWIGFSMTSANLVVIVLAALLMLTVYVYRITHEEAMLLQQFKQKYENYKKHTYKLIPFLY